jgi:hypothetical protein
LRQLVNERLGNRRRSRGSVDDVAVLQILAIKGFVAGLVALESRAVETEAGERPLGVTVENDLRARILVGALIVATCGRCA